MSRKRRFSEISSEDNDNRISRTKSDASQSTNSEDIDLKTLPPGDDSNFGISNEPSIGTDGYYANSQTNPVNFSLNMNTSPGTGAPSSFTTKVGTNKEVRRMSLNGSHLYDDVLSIHSVSSDDDNNGQDTKEDNNDEDIDLTSSDEDSDQKHNSDSEKCDGDDDIRKNDGGVLDLDTIRDDKFSAGDDHCNVTESYEHTETSNISAIVGPSGQGHGCIDHVPLIKIPSHNCDAGENTGTIIETDRDIVDISGFGAKNTNIDDMRSDTNIMDNVGKVSGTDYQESPNKDLDMANRDEIEGVGNADVLIVKDTVKVTDTPIPGGQDVDNIEYGDGASKITERTDIGNTGTVVTDPKKHPKSPFSSSLIFLVVVIILVVVVFCLRSAKSGDVGKALAGIGASAAGLSTLAATTPALKGTLNQISDKLVTDGGFPTSTLAIVIPSSLIGFILLGSLVGFLLGRLGVIPVDFVCDAYSKLMCCKSNYIPEKAPPLRPPEFVATVRSPIKFGRSALDETDEVASFNESDEVVLDESGDVVLDESEDRWSSVYESGDVVLDESE
eukprot:252616_1